MPELPEVETVRRELEKRIIGKVFASPTIYFPKRIKSDISVFSSRIADKKILSLSRRGKFLIFHLSMGWKLLFHLRREGKLYVVGQEGYSLSHLSLFLPFKDGKDALAFYDVRKFGVCYLLREEEEGPLSLLGKEPFDFTDDGFFSLLHGKRGRIKEVLRDQKTVSGIGNIYADEICFAAKVSPFKKANILSKEETSSLLQNAKEILSKAIKEHGSTVRSYKASQKVTGSYQSFLKVYGREGKDCLVCKKTKIRKRSLDGRGTCFCPYCQKRGITLAVTGKIASGKSLATSYFGKHGFLTLSCDEIVHGIYQDGKEREEIKKAFPLIFTPLFDKAKVTLLLETDSGFKHSYLSLINHKVQRKVTDFLNQNDGKDIAVEVPLLFDSHREHLFQYLVGVETTKQLKHLKERGGNASQMKFNGLNSYDRHRNELDFILKSDGTKKELEKQVVSAIRKRKEKEK